MRQFSGLEARTNFHQQRYGLAEDMPTSSYPPSNIDKPWQVSLISKLAVDISMILPSLVESPHKSSPCITQSDVPSKNDDLEDDELIAAADSEPVFRHSLLPKNPMSGCVS